MPDGELSLIAVRVSKRSSGKRPSRCGGQIQEFCPPQTDSVLWVKELENPPHSSELPFWHLLSIWVVAVFLSERNPQAALFYFLLIACGQLCLWMMESHCRGADGGMWEPSPDGVPWFHFWTWTPSWWVFPRSGVNRDFSFSSLDNKCAGKSQFCSG